MNVWFCSDLHFGHKNIQKFRNEISTEEENRQRIKQEWEQVVHKKDLVYVLGDAAFTMETVQEFDTLKGKKILIRGNHDCLNTKVYLKYFEEVYGILKYKEFWLSHAPIHPNELRGKVNLHGHVHYESIKKDYYEWGGDLRVEDDHNYFNCCPENLWKVMGRSLISLDEIRNLMKK